MAATQVQYKTAASSSGQLSLTFDNPTASGNAIIMTVTCRVGTSTPTTYVTTDSNANTYTLAVSTGDVATAQGAALLYAFNIVGGASHSLTLSTSNVNSGLAIVAEEWSGLTTTSPFDKKAGSGAGFAGTITSTTTPGLIQADELAIAGANNRAGSLLTAGAGYTLTTNSIGSQQAAAEYQVLASTDQIAATFTPNTTSANWACVVATFTIAAGGAAAVIRIRDNLLFLGMT